jgi:hypothetical protein
MRRGLLRNRSKGSHVNRVGRTARLLASALLLDERSSYSCNGLYYASNGAKPESGAAPRMA